MSFLTITLFLDSYLSRVDGFVLMAGLVIVMVWLTRLGLKTPATDPMLAEYEAEIPTGVSMPAATLWLLLGLGMLLFGADLVVGAAIDIARELGVTEIVIGVTLVALGTSIPELAVSIISAIKGEYGLAIGNIVGSNIFNLLAVVGIASAIQPTVLAPSVLSLHAFVMSALTLVLFAMTYEYDGKGRITRTEGAALFAVFVGYIGYVVHQNV